MRKFSEGERGAGCNSALKGYMEYIVIYMEYMLRLEMI